MAKREGSWGKSVQRTDKQHVSEQDEDRDRLSPSLWMHKVKGNRKGNTYQSHLPLYSHHCTIRQWHIGAVQMPLCVTFFPPGDVDLTFVRLRPSKLKLQFRNRT